MVHRWPYWKSDSMARRHHRSALVSFRGQDARSRKETRIEQLQVVILYKVLAQRDTAGCRICGVDSSPSRERCTESAEVLEGGVRCLHRMLLPLPKCRVCRWRTSRACIVESLYLQTNMYRDNDDEGKTWQHVAARWASTPRHALFGH